MTFRPQQFVRVASGRLSGMTGTVQRVHDDGRVTVRLTAWGRAVTMRESRLRSEDAEYQRRVRQASEMARRDEREEAA